MRKIRASKCEIRNVPTAEQRVFLNENHVQGYTPCSLCIGLYLGNELVYLQSYGTVRRDNIHYATWDMKRMCGLKDAYIYGGASKLLKYFLENYDLGKGLVTYCDPECFDGHTYEKIGFTLHHICPDDYKYVKDGIEYNKQHGKKSNIWARLKKENPDIEPFDVWKEKHTEREMMEKLGYERVYHKGLIAYTIGTDKKYYIYETVINGYHYIGQHVENGNDNYLGSGLILQNAIEKYGKENAYRKILVSGLSKELANAYESIAISLSRKVYGSYIDGGKNINIADGGQGGNIIAWTNERKKKMSITMKEYYLQHPESLEKMSNNAKEYYLQPPETIEKMRQTKLSQHNHPVAWNKGKTGIFTDEQLEKISQGSKNKSKGEKEELKKVGLIAVSDKAKELGISRAMVLKRFDCFDYYVGKQKYKVCKIGETPVFEDKRGKIMTEKRKAACLKNLGIVK